MGSPLEVTMDTVITNDQLYKVRRLIYDINHIHMFRLRIEELKKDIHDYEVRIAAAELEKDNLTMFKIFIARGHNV